jgi:large subunit ribosomal protein L21
MFAVLKTGGKQYRVAQNDVIHVERVPGEAGAQVLFDQILMVGEGASATAGSPLVAGATVAATLLEQVLADKVIIFKKRRRHNYRRKRGHRQPLSMVRIDEILTDGAKPSPRKEAAPKPAKQAKAKPAEGDDEDEAKPAKKKAAKPTGRTAQPREARAKKSTKGDAKTGSAKTGKSGGAKKKK